MMTSASLEVTQYGALGPSEAFAKSSLIRMLDMARPNQSSLSGARQMQDLQQHDGSITTIERRSPREVPWP